MVGVTVDLGHEVGHHLQFGVIYADLDVEVLHVVRRGLPPELGVIGHVVRIANDGRLAIL